MSGVVGPDGIQYVHCHGCEGEGTPDYFSRTNPHGGSVTSWRFRNPMRLSEKTLPYGGLRATLYAGCGSASPHARTITLCNARDPM
jgi:hypothetical protein